MSTPRNQNLGPVCSCRSIVGRRFQLLKQGPTTNHDRRTVERRDDSTTNPVFEMIWIGNWNLSLLRKADDSSAKGMLRVPLRACRSFKKLLL